MRYESINSRLAVILQERQVRERLADQVRILNQQYSLDERSSWMTYLKTVSYTHLDVYKRQVYTPLEIEYSVMAGGLAVGVVVLAVLSACYKELREKPAQLMLSLIHIYQKKQMSEKEAIGPGSDKTKPMVSSGTEGVVTKRTEYQVNLEVSLKLKSALIARGYNVYMIRETNDVSLSNKKRALMANESGSDILLRIHCNSADSQSANGALTMSCLLYTSLL